MAHQAHQEELEEVEADHQARQEAVVHQVHLTPYHKIELGLDYYLHEMEKLL
ncbi:hypothetical protein [Propionispira arboris]|uniref:hypothetical protein n=1 Tax=Propionispira arboris TaxID=84035 RepID=UPI0015A6CF9B|nr:hypothetical protein [Propionispira arboris]